MKYIAVCFAVVVVSLLVITINRDTDKALDACQKFHSYSDCVYTLSR